MKYSIIVHGGAGNWDGNSLEKQEAVLEACKIGENMLKKNMNPISVVEKVINFMEDIPILNAGKGSVLTLDKRIETDASIMVFDFKTKKTKCGAVANLSNTKNTISVARKVMEETDHIFLVGKGAERFSKVFGFENKEDLIIDFRKKEIENLLNDIKKNKNKRKKIFSLLKKKPELFFGTVGCVVFNSKQIVSGTSTGGTSLKIFGRVGDTPIIGSGTIADKNCGISCTGVGEYAIKTNLAKTISFEYERTKDLKKAISNSLRIINKEFGKGNMGVIGIDRKGKIALGSNTKKFGFAYATNKEQSKVCFKKQKI